MSIDLGPFSRITACQFGPPAEWDWGEEYIEYGVNPRYEFVYFAPFDNALFNYHISEQYLGYKLLTFTFDPNDPVEENEEYHPPYEEKTRLSYGEPYGAVVEFIMVKPSVYRRELSFISGKTLVQQIQIKNTSGTPKRLFYGVNYGVFQAWYQAPPGQNPYREIFTASGSEFTASFWGGIRQLTGRFENCDHFNPQWLWPHDYPSVALLREILAGTNPSAEYLDYILGLIDLGTLAPGEEVHFTARYTTAASA
ncbi:hypothetical protein [Chitinibacter sp. GC72]|uniref:hypothetical protein n=1 Tax=Chitinibacter sp. GC72 TaxID=1526917 RepID=UPI0012F9092F|nr:hypothetical protein [Chitinibacter sp. GC72]